MVAGEGDQRRLYHLQEKCTALRVKLDKLKVEQKSTRRLLATFNAKQVVEASNIAFNTFLTDDVKDGPPKTPSLLGISQCMKNAMKAVRGIDN